MKYLSAMELTTLLNRTKVSVSNLTIYEHRFLSFLLSRVNFAKMETHGYLAWPGTEVIIEYTGMSTATIERIRKTLVAAGWMQYTPGRGNGSSNHYYINATKIVECYIKSGNEKPEGIVARTNIEEKASKSHQRNTNGLVQNKQPVKEIPVQEPEISVESSATEVEKLSNNPDGSPPFHRGHRILQWSDKAKVDDLIAQDESECPF